MRGRFWVAFMGPKKEGVRIEVLVAGYWSRCCLRAKHMLSAPFPMYITWVCLFQASLYSSFVIICICLYSCCLNTRNHERSNWRLYLGGFNAWIWIWIKVVINELFFPKFQLKLEPDWNWQKNHLANQSNKNIRQ